MAHIFKMMPICRNHFHYCAVYAMEDLYAEFKVLVTNTNPAFFARSLLLSSKVTFQFSEEAVELPIPICGEASLQAHVERRAVFLPTVGASFVAMAC